MTITTDIPPEWLVTPTTLSELVDRFSALEQDEMRDHVVGAITQFASSMGPGDELWNFCSPPESWERYCGLSGVAIVRNGAAKFGYLLARN
jgi:hypothetical protein